MVPKDRVEVLSNVPSAVMCLMEETPALGKLCSGMSYIQGLAVTSMLMGQQYILKKAYLNRNTYKTRLGIDQLMEV